MEDYGCLRSEVFELLIMFSAYGIILQSMIPHICLLHTGKEKFF